MSIVITWSAELALQFLTCTLNKKSLNGQGLGHGAALEIPCPMNGPQRTAVSRKEVWQKGQLQESITEKVTP